MNFTVFSQSGSSVKSIYFNTKQFYYYYQTNKHSYITCLASISHIIGPFFFFFFFPIFDLRTDQLKTIPFDILQHINSLMFQLQIGANAYEQAKKAINRSSMARALSHLGSNK